MRLNKLQYWSANLLYYTSFYIVESDPNRNPMIAWDLMNEPEWAVTGVGKDRD